MADQTEVRMNLAAVKRVDPYAKDIVDSSAHVAFYTFNSDENEWEKTDVEGAFFIYSRNAEPLHSIFINNRLNTNSFIEPITEHLELQNQAPFLLYRNERSRIRGFWFYNSSECDRIDELVGRLIKESKISKTAITSSSSTSSSVGTTTATTNSEMKNQEIMQQKPNMATNTTVNNVDIFSMLSKAQEDFNNSQAKTTITTNSITNSVASIPPASGLINNNNNNINNNNNHYMHQPDVTSESVMNFFAAAKPAAAEVPLFHFPKPVPVPVDQIEKQQRATTPQDGRITPPSSSVLHHHLTNFAVIQHQSNSVGGIESAINLLNLNSPKSQPPPPQSQHQQHHVNHNSGTSPLGKFLGTNMVQGIGSGGGGGIITGNPLQPQSLRTLSASEVENNHQNPLQQLLRKESICNTGSSGNILQQQQSNKPALMPPTMFLPSSSSSVPAPLMVKTPNSCQSSIIQGNCIQRQLSTGSDTTPGGSNNLQHRPEPLTQTQLMQAMMYLMQNDPDFVKKLHEAYLKSFTEMVSS